MMRLYTYLSLPGLFIHELMHVIFGALSGYFFSYKESYLLTNRDGSIQVGLQPITRKMNLFQMIMVPMAPLYLILAVAVMAFFNVIFLYVLIYFIITYVYSFPSKGDFNNLRYGKVYLKYKYDDPTFSRFFSRYVASKNYHEEHDMSFLDIELEK